MEMRPGNPSRRSDLAQYGALFDELPELDFDCVEMTVEGEQPETVIQDHRVSEEEEALRQYDLASRRSEDRGPGGCSEVFAAMRASRFVVEDPSLAEAS
jgi:hypothetical protein